MKQINVKASSEYSILVGQSIAEFVSILVNTRGVVITEECLYPRVKELLSGLNFELLKFNGGEGCKNLDFIHACYETFFKLGLDKASGIIAVGGGALLDAAAFAASTYNRGTPFYSAPSTLLAQVDASIGGKNGINFNGVKNLIGTICQPKAVICDFEFLKTLPQSEISFGMAEVIKAAVISDAGFFDQLKQLATNIFDLDSTVLKNVVAKAVQIKADVVASDEFENGARMKLNFGHTLGHAIEVSEQIAHGQAVALGMILEAQLAGMLGLAKAQIQDQIAEVCKQYKLPVTININPTAIADLILKDKKRRGKAINFALPVEIGQVEIFALEINEIEKALPNLCFA